MSRLKKVILDYLRKNNLKVFNVKDLLELGPKDAIFSELSMMLRSGIIKSISRGIYALEGKHSNSMYANAIAKENNWIICPTGSTALKLLQGKNLDTTEYESSGPNRVYKITDGEIKFKHSNNKIVFDISYEALLVIQAIRMESPISQGTIEILSRIENKSKLLSEIRSSTSKVYEILKIIWEM